MTRDEFFAKKSKGALWDVGVSINRTNPLPLDKNAVFESEEALDSYISGVLSYPGQPVAVVTANETKFYILGYDDKGALTKQEVGKPTKGDGASIILDEENKTLSLNGFTAANKDKIASITLGEGDKPVLTWINNTQADLNADLTGVKTDITNLKKADQDINTRIDNLGTVLNFVGTLSVEDFSKTTDSNGIITNANYKVGNVVLVGKEEYVVINTTYYKLTADEIIQSNKTYYSKGSDGTYTTVTDPVSTNPKQDGYYEVATGMRWEGLGDPDGLLDLQKTVKNHTDSIGELTEKANTNTSNISELTDRVDDLETTAGTKADSSALAALAGRVTTAEGEIDDLQANDATLEGKIGENKGLIDQNANAIDALKTKDTELNDLITANKNSIASIKTELDGTAETSGIKARLTATEKVANGAATTANDAKSTAEAAMPKTGGEFSAKVTYKEGTAITENQQLTTKKYVDDLVAGVGIGNYYNKTEIDSKINTINSNINTAQSAAEAAQDAADAAQGTANTNAASINTINKTIGAFDSETMGADIVTYIGTVKATADKAAVKTDVDKSISDLNAALEHEAEIARAAEKANADAIKKEVETDRDAAIAAAKTALIGTGEGATNTTIKGLEVDIDKQIGDINAALDLIKGKTDDLSTVMNFVGVSTTDPATVVTIDGKAWTPDLGDVVIFDGEEYVYTGSKEGQGWQKFGSASASTAAIAELSARITANKNAIESNDTEIAALQAADENIASRIDAIDGTTGTVAKLTERVDKNETDIATNKKAIEDEAKTARAAEKVNADAIGTEKTRAEGVEATLASDIESLTTQLTWGEF